MRKLVTLSFMVMMLGNVSCSDEYNFHPYEPEKPVKQEISLLKYDFLSGGESLKDFSNENDNFGEWTLEERGLAADGTQDAGFYLNLSRRISFEQRATRVRLSLFSDTRFGLHWLERDGNGGSLFTIDAVKGTINIHRYWAGVNDIDASTSFAIENGHTYLLEAVKSFRNNTFTITDEQTGATASVETAPVLGAGQQEEFKGGRQNNVFGFRRISGKSPFIKDMEIVATVSPEPLMYIIVNSITEGDHVRQAARYGEMMASWLDGRVVFSGESGSTIEGVIDRVSNEIPFIRPKFVMVTIGTNRPNTREEVVKLIELIRANGSIPVINRIPVTSDGGSYATNEIIASVCEEMNVSGCRFDLATADNGNLHKQASWLFQEDKIHPTAEGHMAMAKRLFDIPGILLYMK